jgi:hypothetical protein
VLHCLASSDAFWEQFAWWFTSADPQCVQCTAVLNNAGCLCGARYPRPWLTLQIGNCCAPPIVRQQLSWWLYRCQLRRLMLPQTLLLGLLRPPAYDVHKRQQWRPVPESKRTCSMH